MRMSSTRSCTAAGGGAVSALTVSATRTLSAAPRVPMPVGDMPHSQCSGWFSSGATKLK
jgi:hypothetical protein